MNRLLMIATFDASYLTTEERQLLEGQVVCQAERTKSGFGGDGKPDCSVGIAWLDLPDSTPETRTPVKQALVRLQTNAQAREPRMGQVLLEADADGMFVLDGQKRYDVLWFDGGRGNWPGYALRLVR